MSFNQNLDIVALQGADALTQISAYYEPRRKIAWAFLKGSPRPSFSEKLLLEIDEFGKAVRQNCNDIDFCVTGSAHPGIFNLGGDLQLFVSAIRDGDRTRLQSYANACVDATYNVLSGFHADVITIGMVEGTALGGGFEAALSNHFILAQKDSKLGFPEINFNLFPGMGAYSLVARRMTFPFAEKLIFTGEIHTAEWHFNNGLVDRLFEPGGGTQAVRDFVDELIPKLNGVRGMLKARHRVFPVSKQELIDIAGHWVDSAFCLTEEEFSYMERLVKKQNRIGGKAGNGINSGTNGEFA